MRSRLNSAERVPASSCSPVAASIRKTGMSGDVFCETLLNEEQVATIPGEQAYLPLAESTCPLTRSSSS
mgnify:CR=1 FL=1